MATKRRVGKSAKTKKGGVAPDPSGSPIIVDGGGSVTLDYDDNAYNKNGNKHKNKNPNVFVKEIVVTAGGVNQTIQIGGQKVIITVNLQ